MTHDAEKSGQLITASEQYQVFVKSVQEGSRVIVQKPNALGEFDISVFQAKPLAKVLLSIQPSVKDAAKVLLDEYGRVRSGRLDKVQPHDGYIAALSGSALRAISEGE